MSCQRSGKDARLPHGWKRLRDAVYCKECWKQRYVLRAIAIPVVEPTGATWEEFRKALAESWRQATAAANWMMTELYARDRHRDGQAKLPPMARAYLYPEARKRYPGLASQTVVSIENAVQSRYRTARFEVVWTGVASLPSYRYPTPLPVHNQSWEPAVLGERPVVRLRLGERWWQLRLKGGARFRRQAAAYAQMASGEAVRGELTLYRVRANSGKLADRPNGSQNVRYAVMCKMVAWLPRRSAISANKVSRALRVHTAKDMLLVAVNGKDERLWRYHGEHVRRWSAAHRKTLQNLADDLKAEQRPVPSFADRRSAVAVKYRNRMRSAILEIAAQLTGYAARRGFSMIVFDDSVTDFCAQFPYYELREQIRIKCDELGMQFEYTNDRESAVSEIMASSM